MVPFSLPIERPLVSGSQRFAYPQAMRSKRFDSIIVGSSTARLIDPEQLNGPFAARFANMAMNASSAWEQWRTFEYFRRTRGRAESSHHRDRRRLVRSERGSRSHAARLSRMDV